MRTTRIYVDQALDAEARIQLADASARHLLRVLRLSRGARIRVFDGRGNEYAAEMINDTFPLQVQLCERHTVETESPLRITLAQAVAKAERMDYALQKAVELGVDTIQPLLTERTIVRLDQARMRKRHLHWLGIIVAACEQSGRAWLPTLAPILTLPTWLQSLDASHFEAAWVLDPAGDCNLSAAALPETRGLLLIGPEGGLSADELTAANSHGLLSVRLGPRVLRTETAATVALSILQSRKGDLG